MDFNFDANSISSVSTIDPAGASVTISGTGALIVPVGTTAQAPTVTAGAIRFNTDTSLIDFYNGATWKTTQVINTSLTNISALTGAGMISQTSTGNYAVRTIAGVAGQVTVTNGDGVAGSPIVGLSTAGTAGTYTSVTTDAYGRVTSGSTTQAWSTITSTPTTLSGYGITDAVGNAGGVVSNGAGLFSARPTAGTAGRFYYATDLNATYYDNGTAWALATPAFGGDATSTAGSNTLTLATSGVTAGVYGSASQYATFTVDAKGRITAAANVAVPSASISVTGGDLTMSGSTGTAITNATLANTAVTAGVYGAALSVPQITVDSKGRITSAANVTIANSLNYTGDATGSGTVGSAVALTLASTAVTAGSYGNATSVATFTVDAKGRLTAASNVAIASSLTFTGDATGTGTVGSSTALTLANTAVTAGIYGSAGSVAQVTFDSKGRATLAANVAITPAAIGAVATTALGANSGVATLDATGKLTTTQIPTALVGALVYQGVWNATTNTPTLVSSTGTKGQYYKVNVAGTTTIDGVNQWNVGDMIVFNGTTWDKIDGLASEVTSVFGRVGAVTATLASADFANQGTTVTVLHGNAAGNPSWGAINLATDVSGVLPLTATGAMTGDVTKASGAAASVLATVNANTGLWGSATSVGQFTVNGKGLITAAANVTIPNTVALTGDVTATGTTAGSVAATLAASGVTAGVYGNATSVPQITVDTKGRITVGANVAITNSLTFTGDATGTGTVGGSTALTLASSGVTAGVYGSSTQITTFTVDAKGRVTAAANIAMPSSSISVTGGDLTLSGSTGTAITNATLATTGVTAGVYGSGTVSNQLTIDSKGRVTAASNVTIPNTVALTGDVTATGTTSGSVAATLSTTGVTAGAYGSGTQIPTFTVDSKGRLTASANVALTAANAGAVANAGTVPSMQSGTFAAMPAAGTAGRIYVTSDTNSIYRDSGTAWVPVGEATILYNENYSTPVANTVTGANAAVIGSGITNSGANSFATGNNASNSLYGAVVHANGSFATAGDAQSGRYILRNTTSSATPANLFLDGSAAKLVLPNNSAWAYTAQIVGRRTDSVGTIGGWEIKGVIFRDANASTTSMAGTRSKTTLTSSAGLNADVSADATNGALNISVTGNAAQTIRWVATVTLTQVTN